MADSFETFVVIRELRRRVSRASADDLDRWRLMLEDPMRLTRKAGASIAEDSQRRDSH